MHKGEVKLQIIDIVYNPDVLVASGGALENPFIADAPWLLVEVTSPSTKAIDRRENLMLYEQIPGLRAYLIVDQDEPRLWHHWCDEQRQWRYATLVGDAAVPIPCREMALSLDAICARLE